jgi:hypothetical protein
MARSKWNYRFSFLMFFCLAAACWLLSVNGHVRLEKLPPTTGFQNVGSLQAQDYEPMLRSESLAKEPLAFALWSQLDGQRLEGLGTGCTEDVSWLAIKGDTRLLLPVMETLDDEDTDGCLIDAATSDTLFRDANAVGGTVKLGGIEYTVRGVIKSPDRTIITRPEAVSGHALTNITVSGTRDSEAFLMRHSLSAAVTVKSSLYVSLARTLSLLPVLMATLCTLMLLSLLRGLWAGYTVRYLTVSVAMLAVGTAGLLLLFTVIPDGLIPSQWSDFEFWGTAGKDFMRDVTDFISAAKLRPDLIWLYGALQSALGILGAHFVLCLYNLFRIHHGRPVLTYQIIPDQPDQALISDGDAPIALPEAAVRD